MSDASVLRALHVPGDPLVLPNAWDVASARLVVDAGFPVVATSSAAVARSIGAGDHEEMGADAAFEATSRIAQAVDVPVTADVEAGYRLAPDELVERLLAAGASGCNLEDTDHHGAGGLLDTTEHAAFLGAVCAAAGDRLVVNARVDTFIRGTTEPLRDAIERGRRYLDAGAACIYPITASDEGDITALVDALGIVNVMLRPGAPSVARLAELGVARVSLAAGLHRYMTSQVGAALRALRDGDDSPFREG